MTLSLKRPIHRDAQELTTDMDLNQVLLAIQDVLLQMKGSLSNYSDMPQPIELDRTFRSKKFNKEEQIKIVQLLSPKLNNAKMELCDAVCQTVHAPKENNITKQFHSELT